MAGMNDELQCIWCGHHNPPHALECEKCGAPLKPAGEEGPAASAPSRAEDAWASASLLQEDEELRRWLSQFADVEETAPPRAEAPEPEETTEETPSGEATWAFEEGEMGKATPSGTEPLSPEEEDRRALEAWREAQRAASVPEAQPEAAFDRAPSSAERGEGEARPFPETPGEPEAGAEPEEVPEWMASLVGEGPPEGAEEAEPFPEAPEEPEAGAEPEEVPEWMASLVGEGPPEGAEEAEPFPETPGEPEAGAEPEEVPEWMASLVGEGPPEGAEGAEPFPEAPEEPETAAEPEEVPEWMASLVGEGPPEGSEEAEPFPEAPEEPEAAAEPSGTEAGEETEAVEETMFPSPEALAEEEAELAFPEAAPTQEAPPFSEVEVPAAQMLMDEEELESLLGAAAAPETEEGEEAQAVEAEQLPEWVKELRERLEAGPPGVELEEEEEIGETVLAGPLAGIPDVLPVEPRVSQMVEPTRPVLKLLLRKEEQRWVRWLERMVARENEPGRVGEGLPRPMPYWLWRVFVGTVLLLGLLVMLFTGWGPSPKTAPSPPALAFLQTARALPPQSVVVLAADFSPAWAPEVQWAARAAVGQLEPKQPLYLVLGTQPYGPELARDLLNRTGVPEERILSLGYLPGGRVALALLATLPRAAFPQVVGGPDPWAHPRLQGWQGLKDAGMVVVLTDQPVRAREWVEQISPHLDADTPLTFAGSAVLAPVLMPYLGHQVQGWVAGFADAQALAPDASGPNLGRLWYGATFMGLVLAVFSAVTLFAVHRIRERRP